MLKDEELRVEIIQLHYDMLVVGHGRKWKTTELVTRNHWQPGVTKDVGKYVDGKDVILVICDRLFRMMHFVAITEETSAKGLARLFRDNVWKLYGLPESIVLNR